jgi:electron transport complex protein RnfB
MILAAFSTYLIPAVVLAGTGAVFGVLIGVCSKVFAVQVDERLTKLTEILPGYNCGACGYPGCAGLAEAIASKKADPVLCKPGNQEMRDKIKKFMEENYN